MTGFFWMVAILAFFVYVGYPLTLLVLPHRPLHRPGRDWQPPTASIVIAAHNEADHIAETLENKLRLDYPQDHLEIVVVSDGCTDGTDALVSSFADRGVRLLRQEPRQGKSAALNLAVDSTQNEIIVFSDANSIFAADALGPLLNTFSDPTVGYVTGSLSYQNPAGSTVGKGVRSYMSYEERLRGLESAAGSVVGVNGGIDAIRRELYTRLRPDQLPDFVLPLKVVEQRYRVVSCPEAVLYESALERPLDEFQMRVRVSLRSFHALWEMRHLLSPRFGLFAYQLLVHKVLRYLAFLLLVALLVSNSLILNRTVYRLTFALQVGFYATALGGWLFRRALGRSSLTLPFYFVLVNLAAGVAFYKFLRGERMTTWTPRAGG